MLIASVFAVIWIEFVNVKIPVSSFTNANKINSIFENLLIAYISSYCFWFINIFVKEYRSKRILTPAFAVIIRNLLFLYDSYIRQMFLDAGISNATDRLINIKSNDDIKKVLDQYNSLNVVLQSRCYGSTQLAFNQILFDIDELFKFSNSLDVKLYICIFRIHENIYVRHFSVDDCIKKHWYIIDVYTWDFIDLIKKMEEIKAYSKMELAKYDKDLQDYFNKECITVHLSI
jgi:hypothetical protein